MKSILKELYCGDLSPSVAITPTTKEYNALLRKLSDEADYFKDILSKNDFNRLEELICTINDTNALETEEAFMYSFRLCSRFMADIFLSNQ